MNKSLPSPTPSPLPSQMHILTIAVWPYCTQKGQTCNFGFSEYNRVNTNRVQLDE